VTSSSTHVFQRGASFCAFNCIPRHRTPHTVPRQTHTMSSRQECGDGQHRGNMDPEAEWPLALRLVRCPLPDEYLTEFSDGREPPVFYMAADRLRSVSPGLCPLEGIVREPDMLVFAGTQMDHGVHLTEYRCRFLCKAPSSATWQVEYQTINTLPRSGKNTGDNGTLYQGDAWCRHASPSILSVLECTIQALAELYRENHQDPL